MLKHASTQRVRFARWDSRSAKVTSSANSMEAVRQSSVKLRIRKCTGLHVKRGALMSVMRHPWHASALTAHLSVFTAPANPAKLGNYARGSRPVGEILMIQIYCHANGPRTVISVFSVSLIAAQLV